MLPQPRRWTVTPSRVPSAILHRRQAMPERSNKPLEPSRPPVNQQEAEQSLPTDPEEDPNEDLEQARTRRFLRRVEDGIRLGTVTRHSSMSPTATESTEPDIPHAKPTTSTSPTTPSPSTTAPDTSTRMNEAAPNQKPPN